jgi:hypothetical protein
MNEKEVRRLVRTLILEKFEKTKHSFITKQQDKLEVMTESEVRKIIRDRLREGVIDKVSSL